MASNSNRKANDIKAVFFRGALIFLFVICCMLCNISSVAAGAEKEQELTYDSLGYRDPMMPLVTTSGLIRDFGPASTSSDSHLEGIIYDQNDNSLAIIDGEIVEVGDVVGGMRILEIQEDRVIIQKDGELREIKLEEE
ncbi:MAG TPA: hypothetical protein ENH41_05795 [Candidatus Omnitrophica bacterium]|nr:hypothetical protein [Candidatus Omnitrophota bacterium]